MRPGTSSRTLQTAKTIPSAGFAATVDKMPANNGQRLAAASSPRKSPAILFVRNQPRRDDSGDATYATLGRHRARPRIDLVTSDEEARVVLEDRPIDVVVIAPGIPLHQGLDLVSYMIHRHPTTAVVLASDAVPEERHAAGHLGLLAVPWPLGAETADLILGQTVHPDRQGVSLPDLVRLLRRTSLTCTLDIRANKQDPWAAGADALIAFDGGRLVHAEVNEETGEAALHQLLGWRAPEVRINFNNRIRNGSVDSKALWATLQAAISQRAGSRALESNPAGDVDRPFSAGGATPGKPSTSQEKARMSDVNTSLEEALKINGALGAALVDFKTGMCLGQLDAGSGIDLELAAAGNTEVVRAKRDIVGRLGLAQEIEDILITLSSQYHLIRVLHNNANLFFYLVLDRGKANLAMARMGLERLDQQLSLN
jgi:Domain of unknown function (DUF4388)